MNVTLNDDELETILAVLDFAHIQITDQLTGGNTATSMFALRLSKKKVLRLRAKFEPSENETRK